MRYGCAKYLTALLLFSLLAVPSAIGQAAGRGYGQRGYGGSGPGGMMGGGYGRGGGYGMIGPGYGQGYGRGATGEVSFEEAMQLLGESGASAKVDKPVDRVSFTGSRVLLSMAAVQPGFPDTTFEVAGLVDPTIVIPAGSTVTLHLINMDYGNDMEHGVVLTPVGPPYPVMSMMGLPDTFAGVPILSPRTSEDARSSSYAEGSVTFVAPPPGVYYYLCQYYDHAAKGMYGKLIVRVE